MKKIDDILKGKVLFVGIGNEMRGDDGIGPFFVKKGRRLLDDYQFLNVKETPENYFDKMLEKDIDTLIFVDAVDFNSSPGTIKLFGKDQIVNSSISTHNSSLKMSINFLKQFKANLRIFLIGIQPENCQLNNNLSFNVKSSIDRLLDKL
ncbi:MAG: hydrogenase maturation protease [Candidatus Mcinerneyibacterium aminivorans]|uniref:Hydrogenase maturation protease n=1 Tax=Candidatus Mcinerneyibacterium aminivorans TaxID=2703815 RepID=A0A5D0MMC2_9BACT|nr:MAG: hydrogenase maturation protease [Candidatus Mcinerneyibacterium aminivorans]